MNNRINFSQLFNVLGNLMLKGSKVLLFAGGLLFVVIWKIVGHFLGIATGMADYMVFGNRKKNSWW